MKPEHHIGYIKEGCYTSSVELAKDKEMHIECLLSKEDIGNLLQGKAVNLLFLNNDYELAGMIDIKLSDGQTKFNISDKLNNLITGDWDDNIWFR